MHSLRRPNLRIPTESNREKLSMPDCATSFILVDAGQRAAPAVRPGDDADRAPHQTNGSSTSRARGLAAKSAGLPAPRSADAIVNERRMLSFEIMSLECELDSLNASIGKLRSKKRLLFS